MYILPTVDKVYPTVAVESLTALTDTVAVLAPARTEGSKSFCQSCSQPN